MESEHKGQVAIQITIIELLLFVFATFNYLLNENYAHTPKKQFIYFNLVITFQTQS